MENENSIEYLQSLKNKSRDRYMGKPCKPMAAEVAQKQQSNSHVNPSDVLMQLYIAAARRLNARGIRPLPYVKEAEDGLNETWRICLLGWASLDYFKKSLDIWELKTGGCDNRPQQEELAF